MDSLLQSLQPLLAAAFTLWGSPVTWLEMAAFVLAVAMVVFNILVKPVAWPLAIISSLLYFALFWNGRLYGEASLQVMFVVVAGWGWWQWLRGTQSDGRALSVRPLDRRGRAAVVVAWLVAWPAIGWFLARYTDNDVPWLDAFPTAGSLVGQWLLARKYIENWPAWVIVNVASVALFVYKEYWLTVLLYAVFIAMSFVGWRAWHRLAAQPAP